MGHRRKRNQPHGTTIRQTRCRYRNVLRLLASALCAGQNTEIQTTKAKRTMTDNQTSNVKGLYAIFDSVAGFYSPVFQAENDAHAIRMFQSSIDMNHKNDFALWKIGQYDNDNGNIIEFTPKLTTHGKNLKEPKQ
ncbi:nonstructural protein [Microviridae sp.]|nr:nonstructural protein [Microviridae sp.]